MQKNLYLLASIIIHAILLILFLILYKTLTIIHLILFLFIPIILSLLIFSSCYLINQYKTVGVFSIINILYIILFYIILFITKADDIIYLNSIIYVSEYVEVSQGNSPVFSLIILCILSFAIHFFVKNIIESYFKRKENKNETN